MKKKILSIALVAVVVLTLVFVPAYTSPVSAASSGQGSPRDTTLNTDPLNDIGKYSSNMREKYASPITSYLVENSDGSMTSVKVTLPNISDYYFDGFDSAMAADGRLAIETFTKSGQILSTKELEFELPLFGGFFSGEKYNFIAFGQASTIPYDTSSPPYDTPISYNYDTGKWECYDPTIELIRIVKYDKNFNRLDSVSITGTQAYAVQPFSSGSAYGSSGSMAEYGDTLVMHTSRLRPDNHQSNLTIILDTKAMDVTYISPDFPANHVSHSFDQSVIFDGDTPTYLDLGDGNPRAVVFIKGHVEKGNFPLPQLPFYWDFGGEKGDNYTGVMTGGLAASENNYLTVVSAIDRNKFEISRNNPNDYSRDIIVSVLLKDNAPMLDQYSITVGRYTDTGGDTVKQMTQGLYDGRDTIPTTPRLISNGDNTFTVLWQEIHISYPADRVEWLQSQIDEYGFDNCRSYVSYFLIHTPGDYVAQLIDGNGQPVGRARRFYDVNDFYKEYFGITFFPGESGSGASSWALDGIASALTKGFVPAEIQNNYTATITRAEFCRMAVKWLEYRLGKPIETILSEKGLTRDTNAFTDTSDPDILAAFALGITNGTGDKQFTPDGQFSREQAATMIMNTCKAADMDVSNITNAGFADIGTASAWAVSGINFVRNAGIMSGTGDDNFSPKAAYTREQSIITFNNIK